MQPRPRKVAKQKMDWKTLGVIQGEIVGVIMNCVFIGIAIKVGGLRHDSESALKLNQGLYDIFENGSLVFLCYMVG